MSNNHQSDYYRWTWIVAVILLLVLCWMLLTGKGHNNSCCAPSAMPTTAENTAVADRQNTSVPFSFSASASEFSSNGDSSDVPWIAKSDSIKSMLSGDVKIEGDKSAVKLTGNVEQQEVKDKIMADAQVFFGENVTIDNQILVNAPQATAAHTPELAKIYFATGKSDLPENAQTLLEPIISWSKAHPDSKVVLSGFHDVTGNLATNQELAKHRAQAISKALSAAGIAEAQIELRKPQSTEGSGSLEEARRVEVSVE